MNAPKLEIPEAVAKPAAYIRRWQLDGEREHKVLNPKTGRMGLPFKFKLKPVTLHKCLPDDEPLYPGNLVAELVAADREYEEARRDWDRATGSDPKSLQDEEWVRIADRFEAACMRRLKAMDKFGEVK